MKMISLIGQIQRVSTTTVSLRKFRYKEFLDDDELFGAAWEEFFSLVLTLKFEKSVVDALIEHSGKICEFSIENGLVKSVKPIGTISEIAGERDKKPLLAEARAKLKIVLSRMPEDPIEGATLFEMLEVKDHIAQEEADSLISHLLREGIIYEARIGYLAKTPPTR